jgi:hypothetical protein
MKQNQIQLLLVKKKEMIASKIVVIKIVYMLIVFEVLIKKIIKLLTKKIHQNSEIIQLLVKSH